MQMDFEKLKETCDTLSKAAKYYDNDNIINFNNNLVVFENGLDCYGICVKSGIETLASYLQEPLELKIEEVDLNEYTLTKQFYYKGSCFYQIEYILKSNIKDGVIYDNTSHKSD